MRPRICRLDQLGVKPHPGSPHRIGHPPDLWRSRRDIPTAVSPLHDHVSLLVQTVLTAMERVIESENAQEQSDEAGRWLNWLVVRAVAPRFTRLAAIRGESVCQSVVRQVVIHGTAVWGVNREAIIADPDAAKWWSLKRVLIILWEVKCSRCCVLVVPGHPNPNLETALGNFWAMRHWDEAEGGMKGRFKGVS